MNWKWARVPVFLVKHAISAVAALASIRGVELFTEYLWHGAAPKLLDIVEIRYIFEGMDLGILGLYAFWGLVEANRVFRDTDR